MHQPPRFNTCRPKCSSFGTTTCIKRDLKHLWNPSIATRFRAVINSVTKEKKRETTRLGPTCAARAAPLLLPSCNTVEPGYVTSPCPRRSYVFSRLDDRRRRPRRWCSESDHLPVYYFPIGDVREFARADNDGRPVQGVATHYSLNTGIRWSVCGATSIGEGLSADVGYVVLHE